jgi:hypothetical protein
MLEIVNWPQAVAYIGIAICVAAVAIVLIIRNT